MSIGAIIVSKSKIREYIENNQRNVISLNIKDMVRLSGDKGKNAIKKAEEKRRKLTEKSLASSNRTDILHSWNINGHVSGVLFLYNGKLYGQTDTNYVDSRW